MNYLLLCLILLGAGLPKRPVKPAPQPVVVLELFTSQGCSSCPPADRTLQEITRQAAVSGQLVYGLSFHVDYWNRLGWKDPFSNKLFTDRQRQYDRILKSQTYTPQLIINGQHDLIGGQRAKIQQTIQTIQQQPASTFVGVDARLVRNASQITVSYMLSTTGPYRVNVVLFQKEAQTMVKNGENGGRTLVNTNVVREFRSIDNGGTAGSVTLPSPTGLRNEQTAVLVYVQRTDTGQVIGAKQL